MIQLDDQYAFRYSNYDTPLWVRQNTSAGRWNRLGEEVTQYWSLDAQGAWAELAREENLRTAAELDLIEHRLWLARWRLGPVADLRRFENAAAFGLTPEALVDEDYTRCQSLGERLRAEGIAGVLYLSAALPGSINLAVFGPRIKCPWTEEPSLASQVSCQIVGVTRPDGGMAPHIRHRGREHRLLEEYRRQLELARARPPQGPQPS